MIRGERSGRIVREWRPFLRNAFALDVLNLSNANTELIRNLNPRGLRRAAVVL